MAFVQDAFPFRESYDPPADDTVVLVDPVAKENMLSYQRLLDEAMTPLYEDYQKTALTAMLRAMQLKQSSNMTNTSFNKWAAKVNYLLPKGNKYPESYAAVKNKLKKIGMGYKIIHACYYGCSLFCKEYADLDQCPVCGESRWEQEDTGSGKRIARKTVRYFPLTPWLQLLYMSERTAKEMRWHGERFQTDPDLLRHLADGEAWMHFDRNVRLALASDGFSPYGSTAVPYSAWPVIVMPYNLPPHLCMKKEFNMLVLLISGSKSPRKCLNVFMRPVIDELKMLWETGVSTWDRYGEETFNMRAAVMLTINDFPGLGMLGGIQTKWYKACPKCLDDIDAVHSNSRMSYQGARRWVPEDHPYQTQPLLVSIVIQLACGLGKR